MTEKFSRIQKKKIDKQIKAAKRDRKFSRFALFTSITFIVSSIAIGFIIYTRYNQTVKWRDVDLTGKEADVPPEFAKNTYSFDMLSDINKLSNVTTLLKEVENNNGLTSENIQKARSTLKQSESILKEYKITGGESYQNQENLKLDIDVYDIEQSAYNKPDAKKLSDIINRVHQRNLTKETTVDTEMLKRLNVIAQDYNKLNEYVNKYIPKIGTINNNVVTVKTSITQKLTTDMLNNLENNNLTKFPNIKKLQKLLTSASWSNVIRNNNRLKEKESWDNTIKIFDTLSKDEYVAVSDIKTLKDAQQRGFNIKGLDARPGYNILHDSPINYIMVDGNKVTDGQYIYKLAHVTVYVDPTYEKDPNYKEPESSSSEETSSSSSSSKAESYSSESSSSSSESSSSSSSSSSFSSSSSLQSTISSSSSSSQSTTESSRTTRTIQR